MADKKIGMSLPKITLDDMFSIQEQRDDAKLERIKEISIDLIDEFPSHPFKVLNNIDMTKLVDSIKESGIVEPVILREKDNGRYEMISGHRRMKAGLLSGLKTVPSIIRNLSDDEATIIMVDSNLKREKLLPSEKAFAYKMKMEAISHQGKTSRQVVGKLESADEIGLLQGESGRQIQRYIRLTNLIPELLKMVDKEIIAFSPAVEISFLSKDMQLALLDFIEYFDATPSHAQAIEMKKLSQKGELKIDDIKTIMKREKPNQIEKIKFDATRIRNVLPKNIEESKVEDYVVNALKFYERHLKQREMSER